ncbi:hypothetical protein EUTSA_v10019376mg [Eutrema salsugineum]|uniref:Uncharacterized protein n=1 Tax=Eutrema salsugineum TaxID=72664 RepID=V4KLG4_EUTSA|nr:CLAVATA3/ESR (CLE)-related protein 17 [Eutrema salsugineum]ESQ28113.1 hypothetical protein EUTSA_v10019376mg [Eutrema salsugineum]
MTHVLVRRERQGRKTRRWDMKMTMCFFLFVMFQISLSSSSASVDSRRHFFSTSSPPRKTLVYATTPFRGPLSRDGNIYGEDKRVVHTGPNPLHN